MLNIMAAKLVWTKQAYHPEYLGYFKEPGDGSCRELLKERTGNFPVNR